MPRRPGRLSREAVERTSPRWKVITTTEHPHEQLGLDLLRDCLPDQPPFLALANFEFVADSGHV